MQGMLEIGLTFSLLATSTLPIEFVDLLTNKLSLRRN